MAAQAVVDRVQAVEYLLAERRIVDGERAGLTDDLDEGTIALPGEGGVAAFVSELGKLRVWGREPALKLGKASPPVE